MKSVMQDKKKAKILIVGLFPPPYSSGFRVINKYVADLLQEQFIVTQLDMSVGILTPSTSIFQSLIYYIRNIFHFFKIFTQVYHISRKDKIDLCYLSPSSTKIGHLRDIIIVRLLNKNVSNVVLNIQSGDYSEIFNRDWHKKLTRKYIERVTLAIFTSEVLKNRCLTYISENKCRIIRNTVDISLICSNEEVIQKITNHKNKTNFNICYISNMVPTKGYMDMFEAIKMLNEQERENLSVDYVGEWLSKDQEKEFRELIEANNLAQKFKIHGKVNNRKLIKSFYLTADVFVLPTYFAHEAQPVSLIEALNAGVPVITTRHASIPEFITNNYNGILVDKQSPEQIKDALVTLKYDKETYTLLANNARKSFNETFSHDKVKGDWLELITNAINKSN